MSVKENLKVILDKIHEVEKNSGRKEGSVKLMAVSKFHPEEAIREAINEGQILFGENRVQEASSKFPQIYEDNPNVESHIIGQLQSNKVKNAVKIAKCIQSVDRLSLIEAIEKHCSALNKTIDILFEVHTGEDSKSGFTSVDELKNCLNLLQDGKFPHVIPIGFMTMAPFTDDKDRVRKSFTTLRELRDELQKEYPSLNLKELSMGMSGDFEIAIEEGSTMVRVGTAIFGERDYTK